MNCPSCGAPLHLDPDRDYSQCDYCKAYYFPDQNEEGVRVFGEESQWNCPLCAVRLQHATVAGVRFLYCTQCRGMLIPMEIFDGLLGELRAQLGVHPRPPHPPDPAEFDRRISCPKCGSTMDNHSYAGPGNIVIDSCSRCFVNWLDHGELMRVAHASDPMWRAQAE